MFPVKFDNISVSCMLWLWNSQFSWLSCIAAWSIESNNRTPIINDRRYQSVLYHTDRMSLQQQQQQPYTASRPVRPASVSQREPRINLYCMVAKMHAISHRAITLCWIREAEADSSKWALTEYCVSQGYALTWFGANKNRFSVHWFFWGRSVWYLSWSTEPYGLRTLYDPAKL